MLDDNLSKEQFKICSSPSKEIDEYARKADL